MNIYEHVGGWKGSSPRVRSRLGAFHGHDVHVGIISACAEQTYGGSLTALACRDHLRVCGADSKNESGTSGRFGSSPRVRSRLHHPVQSVSVDGIISACAEQTTVGER